MMVQSAPAGEPHFTCTMAEHNDLCGQFARAFGNDGFERLEPFEEMVYVVSHHDRGWDERDRNPVLDPASGLPCGIGGAPVPGSSDTIRKSPDFNERHHPYCGLLSSMHCWGLYNARYGFSDFRVRPSGPVSIPVGGPNADETEAMLHGELERQAQLEAALAADPGTRSWVDRTHLLQNYKQLQFFDTLALYFHLRHASEREEEVFTHVPRIADEDASVTLTPLGGGAYRLSPFPFAGEKLAATCHGRYVTPFEAPDAPEDLAAFLDGLPTVTQEYLLVAG